MDEKVLNDKIAVASLKLAVIQPAFNGTFPDMSKKDYYERMASKPLKMPDGSEVRYTPGTMSCWESDYRKGGFDALIPKERSDKGLSRALDADAIAAIYAAREKYPRLSAVGIRQKLISDGIISATDASDASFQRFIKKNNLKGASAPSQKDRRAFEEEFCTGMYQADTLHGPYITEEGSSKKTYCIMIIDDKSRLIVGGKFFYEDNAINFQKVFHDAVATFGVPKKLYVDNGSTYTNDQLPLICGQLGTVLIHTKVRDGAAKGKIERNFKTLRSRFLNALDPKELSSIDELNKRLADYIRQHNTTVHSSIAMTPYTRYMEDISHVTMPKSDAWLDECFLHRVKRKVRNDATVSIRKNSYDVPMEFIRATVEIRYVPGDYGSAFIFYNNKRYPIRLTDKVANSKTKRNNDNNSVYELNYGGSL